MDNQNLNPLNELNQYFVDNAWFKVNFGGCKYGILSAACPIEPLHPTENGIIPKCIEILFKEQIKSMETCEYEDYSQSVFSSLYKRTFDGHTTKPYVMSIDVWAFVRHCLIIPYDINSGKVIYV